MPEDPLDELAFVRRSAFDPNGERKTDMIGERDHLRTFVSDLQTYCKKLVATTHYPTHVESFRNLSRNGRVFVG